MTHCRIIVGDVMRALADLKDESVQCVVTSPPYFGLRNYGVDGQMGLEKTPGEYLDRMVGVFREVRRVLRKDGICWINMGDSYAGSGKGPTGHNGIGDQIKRQGFRPGSGRADGKVDDRAQRNRNGIGPVHGFKPKDLMGMPWRLAFALQADGWYLRQDIIWHKPNPMPESMTDRCTKAHEYIFLMTKSAKYHFNNEAIKEPSVEADWQSRLTRSSLKSAPTDEINGIRRRSKAASEFPGEAQRDENRRRSWNGSSFDKGKTGEMKHTRGNRFPTGWANEGSHDAIDHNTGMRKRNDRFGGNKHTGETTKYSDGSIFTGSSTRNKRSVWTINTQAYREAHFATFPEEIPTICIKASTRPGDTVMDPFSGSGTSGLVAARLGRDYVGIELNHKYAEMSERRINNGLGTLLNTVTIETVEK